VWTIGLKLVALSDQAACTLARRPLGGSATLLAAS
jgi:hypothetical protein